MIVLNLTDSKQLENTNLYVYYLQSIKYPVLLNSNKFLRTTQVFEIEKVLKDITDSKKG